MKGIVMNPTNVLRRSMGTALLGALVLATSGCALLAPKTPEEQVAARAGEFWKARTTGHLDKAYALTLPSYRQVRSLKQFTMQFGAGGSIQSVEVTKVTCEKEKCTAKMKLGVKPALIGMDLGTISTYLDEVWLLEGGQWWHYQDL